MNSVVSGTSVPPVVQYFTPSHADAERTDFLVKDLSRGSQLVLWSIRKWVRNRLQRVQPTESLADAYRLAKIPNALDELDEMMTLLSHVAIRQLLIECTCRPTLSGDELIILKTLRALQTGHVDVARLTIARIIAGKLGHTFCRTGDAYVSRLSSAGLTLSRISRLSLVTSQG